MIINFLHYNSLKKAAIKYKPVLLTYAVEYSDLPAKKIKELMLKDTNLKKKDIKRIIKLGSTQVATYLTNMED